MDSTSRLTALEIGPILYYIESPAISFDSCILEGLGGSTLNDEQDCSDNVDD